MNKEALDNIQKVLTYYDIIKLEIFMECIGYLEENNTLRFVINDEYHVMRGGGYIVRLLYISQWHTHFNKVV